jgi:hypothetical protein
MSRDNGLVLRFAVGHPDGPRSAVWRVWATPRSSDVYVTARTLGGVAKVSLHESGRWRFAFTKEYSEDENSLAPSEGDRVIGKWNRPPEVADGITPAFMVSVPSAEVTEPRLRLPEVDRKYTSKVVRVPPRSPAPSPTSSSSSVHQGWHLPTMIRLSSIANYPTARRSPLWC